MKKSPLTLAALCLLSGWTLNAQAYTCTVSVTDISMLYSPNATADVIATGSYSLNCTRTLIPLESATLAWDLAVDNGLQPNAAQNRVQLGASTNRYNYETYRIPTYTNPNRWQAGNALRFSGTLNFGSGTTASQAPAPFYVRMAPAQTARPAGLYTDSMTATLRIDTTATVLDTAVLNIAVTTQNECRFTTPPSNINFSYTSFQATPAIANGAFQVSCTPAMSYSMALNALTSPLLGLNYSLNLSNTSGVGTGMAQSYSINGSIPAGQAGSCAGGPCSGTQARTLTITY